MDRKIKDLSCLKMSHFYYLCLIYLLIYRDFVSSYDYEDVPRRDYNEKPNAIRSGWKKTRLKDKSRVAHFDVARFIQKPDDIESSVPNGIENLVENRRKISEDLVYEPFNYISPGVIKLTRNKNEKLDNFDVNLANVPEFDYNEPLSKEIVNGRQPKLPRFDDQMVKFLRNEKRRQVLDNSFSHNLEKKCSIKNMKFPFFSHKSQNNKKKMKHKMFPNNTKKEDGIDISTKSGTAILADDNNFKRFNIQRNGGNKLKDQQNAGQEIHNSRQYFQQKPHNFIDTDNAVADSENNKEVINAVIESSTEEDDNDYIDDTIEARKKRSEDDDNDRRLKVLDEIQRKIDNVEIHVPSYTKMP